MRDKYHKGRLPVHVRCILDEFASKKSGKVTIDLETGSSSSRSKPNLKNQHITVNESSSKNYGIQGRELMTTDELRKMRDNECILLVRGISLFIKLKIIGEEKL